MAARLEGRTPFHTPRGGPSPEENHNPVSRHHNDPGPTNTNLQGGLDPEGNHGPASSNHRDLGPTSTDLQGGLVPEGSCRVAA